MVTTDTRFQQMLSDWLDQHANDPAGVCFVDLAEHRCVVKRQRGTWLSPLVQGVRFIRSGALSWLCWFSLGERPPIHVLLQNSLRDEARRLARLKAAGCPVPNVWYQAQQVLVLEYVGQDMPYLIRLATPAGRLQLMTRAAQALASFHQAGFVHGGAQLRNLMVEGDTITRIDFEENIGEALSLPVGQADDVYQMLSSMAGLRGHEFTPPERQALCDQLLGEYLVANPDPLVRLCLTRLGRSCASLKKYLGWLLKRIPGRDVQGFLYVTNSLRL